VAAGVGVVALALTTGCIFQPRWDSGTAQFFSEELANASKSTDDLLSSTAKASTAATETTTVDCHIERYSYDNAVNGYVRSSVCTTSEGYERVREDTVYLYEDGNKVEVTSMHTLDSARHTRNVRHRKGGVQADVDIVIQMDVRRENGKTYGEWNGTLSGTYDNQRIAEGEVDSLTREWKTFYWACPEAGNLYLDFPRFKYEIEYTGGCGATAWITNKRRDKVHQITVNVN
jgi:hypothetical protein